MSDPQIIPFQNDHLGDAVRLSAGEGWPHRPDDWALVAAISRPFVARDGDRIVGTAFCTPYGEDVAMLNMIIVDATMRGRGLGRLLVETIIAEAGEREMRLVATEAGRPLYAKLGFVEGDSILQYNGEIGGIDRPAGCEDAGLQDWPAIIELDRVAFGGDRHSLFDRLQAHGKTVVMRERDGRISGFAVCRRFGRGFVVGPVVAQNLKAAQSLIATHLAGLAGSFVRIDTFATTGLASWLADKGLAHIGGGVAMTCGASAQPSPSSACRDVRTFALAAQSLG